MLRTLLAIIIGRFILTCCRLFKRGGTSLPGYIALKIDPGLMHHITSRYKKVIIVTGTNGKTTTTNLLAEILKAAGFKVLHNSEGANMPAGITTALLGPVHDIAVLESDEGTLGLVTKQVKADAVIITNLLRDQLDRYHELEQLAAAIKCALADIPGVTLFLNADDSLVTSLGKDKSRVKYYGMERTRWSITSTDEVLEGHICPDCGQPLRFNYYHYSHLGDYFCPHCPYKRPNLAYKVRNLQLIPGDTQLDIFYPGGKLTMRTQMLGIYNIYNILASASAALHFGISPAVVADVVAGFLPGQGRAEILNIGDKHLTLMLVKNPTGLSVALKTITGIHEKAAYLLAINDLAADGRDVSWLWDADLSPLVETKYTSIICSGLRAGDIAICLKYHGIDTTALEVIPDQKKSLERLLAEPVSDVVVLCTYTNLAVYRKLLKSREAKNEAAPVSSLPRTS